MASKTKTTYLLNPFDRKKAASGELCVMVASSVGPTKVENNATIQNRISNIEKVSDTWVDNTNFKGAGICIFRAPNNFILIVDNTTFTFNERGEAANIETKGWHLLMGQIDETAQATGNAVVIKTKTVIKRNINATPIEEDVQQAGESPLFDGDGEGGTSSNGNDDIQPDPGREIDPGAGRVIDDIATIYDVVTMEDVSDSNGNTVVVDSLNARDQFAMQALGELLGHIPDPSVLGENERNHFCNSAYAWAANMMTAAAKARATIVYTKEGTEEEDTEVSGITLNNNTEKLLNNIAAAIDNNKSGGSSSVSIPALITWLNNYSAGATEGTTVGLKDLITAINGISSGGSGGTTPSGGTDVSGIVNALKSGNDTVEGHLAVIASAIYNSALGGNSYMPLHIATTYNFPNMSMVPTTHNASAIRNFLTFNSSGIVGNSTRDAVTSTIMDRIMNSSDTDIQNNLEDFSKKIIVSLGGSGGTSAAGSYLYSILESYINAGIKAWLTNNTDKVSIGSNQYYVIKVGAIENA